MQIFKRTGVLASATKHFSSCKIQTSLWKSVASAKIRAFYTVLSPDGKPIAYATQGPQYNKFWLFS